METIGKLTLWSFLDGSDKARRVNNNAICQDRGHRVSSYLEMARKVAEIQFRNRDCVLLFRGQNCNFLSQEGKTTLKPSLFRPDSNAERPPDSRVLTSRFEVLRNAEHKLAGLFTRRHLLGHQQLERYRVLRWSILQHYEVCPTPLLDVTHSLRIAASFGSAQANGEAFLYAIGLPNLSGMITASAEAGLQTVRLASVCPPTAVRPHIQEGYLLGEYPEMADYEQKQFYHSCEIDFARRLVAKFRFDPATFWERNPGFPPVAKDALYPDTKDPLFLLTRQVKQIVNPDPAFQEPDEDGEEAMEDSAPV
jgi:hypothetical protein